HPVRELAEGLRECPETILTYDASHVLGLIAGGRFQDPLGEGAQLVFGGTQKSFPGPQGGVIYSNSVELMQVMGSNVHPVLVSNHHLARLPSMGLALIEMKQWGAAYADQIIRNARRLGSALAALDVPVVAPDRGFTRSHTVLLSTSSIDRAAILGQRLDDANIIVTAVRLPKELGSEGLRVGVNEITRRGADTDGMMEVARLIADVLLDRRPTEQVKADVTGLVEKLQAYLFTFPQD
ncbi:MAG: serine hydroxymethyltransferase, partial [Anaerolineae bacterium]|nr:serine hydroxymethyltransferase [Anaerolineae bacterium]